MKRAIRRPVRSFAARLWVASAFALALVVPTGCAIGRMSVNEPLDARAIEPFEPGVTTAAEVVDALGAPSDVVQLGRRSAYRYDSQVAKGTGLVLLIVNFGHMDSRSDRVWVFFDEDDRLTHVAGTFATHRTRYALPWSDVHDPKRAARADRRRPGLGAQ